MSKPLNMFVDGLMRFTYVCGAICIGLMMVHVTIHVLCLYLLSFPLPVTYLVVSNYYMVTITFLCIGLAEMKGSHISVDFLHEAMPRWMKAASSVFASLLTTAVFTIMGWRGLENAIAKTKSGSYDLEYGIKLISWPSYYLVPIGSFLVVLVVFAKLLKQWQNEQ